MRIGVPREIKDREDRVGMVPGAVAELVAKGHEVIVEHDAGKNIGFSDADYAAAGAKIAADADAVWAAAEMIVKVKEPQASERRKLRAGPAAVHLSASRARSGADAGPHRLRRHLHRL